MPSTPSKTPRAALLRFAGSERCLAPRTWHGSPPVPRVTLWSAACEPSGGLFDAALIVTDFTDLLEVI